MVIPCIGIFHNLYDTIAEELRYQVLTAIIKELAVILKVDVAIASANETPATVEMVRVAMVMLLVTMATSD